MANGKFDLRGLLYSPEILGGLGLLGQGFAGKTPSVQPIMQGMQTANIFDVMRKRKERDVWAEEYTKTLPEGSILKDIFKFSPDKGVDYITKLELAKINAGNKKTTAMRNADALGLTLGSKEYNDYIQASTIKTDTAAQALQTAGLVVGGAARDKLVKDIEVVSNVNNQLNEVILQKIDEDPTLAGGVGWLRKKGNQLGTLLKDLDVDVERLLPEGTKKDFFFDKDIPTLTALENTVAAAYAKVLYPGQRITNKQIDIARDIVGIRGLEGSEAVKARLEQVSKEMKRFISSYRNLLGAKQKIYTIEELRLLTK